jgi:cell wall-associated NlpC family hydrolase
VRLGSQGVLAVTVTVATAVALGPSARADRNDPLPTQAQVDQAEAAAVSRAGDVASLRARLAVANARVERAAERAEVAAEQYNGAVWRLGQARQRATDARADASSALAKVEQQRAGIAQLVTQSYQDPALETITAVVDADGPVGLMTRLGVVQSAGASMQARFDDYRALNALARVAQAKAEEAEWQAAALVREAGTLRDRARHAEAAAKSESAHLSGERRRLIGELARAQKISVALATERQEGLERKAAEAAAAAKAKAEAKAKAGQAPPGPPRPSDQGPTDAPTPRPSGGDAAAVAVDFALAQLGETYRWGAAGPDAWDCSGLTMAAWRQAGVSLPHYSAAQYAQVEHISADQLRPGDLVFWGASPGSIHHVALYIGDGKIVHAPRTGRPVSVDSMYYWVPPDYFGRP